MGSKRKTRKALKAGSATQGQEKSQVRQDKPKSKEGLIRFNGELVENLFNSQAWDEIVFPLLSEMIASVSGRFTNGRFHKGELTKNHSQLGWLAGYQCALEELHNNLDDFIVAKENLRKKKIEEESEKKSTVYNPFLEELHEEEEWKS